MRFTKSAHMEYIVYIYINIYRYLQYRTCHGKRRLRPLITTLRCSTVSYEYRDLKVRLCKHSSGRALTGFLWRNQPDITNNDEYTLIDRGFHIQYHGHARLPARIGGSTYTSVYVLAARIEQLLFVFCDPQKKGHVPDPEMGRNSVGSPAYKFVAPVLGRWSGRLPFRKARVELRQ